MHEKLDARSQNLEVTALRRTSFVGDLGNGRIADDPAAYMSYLSPFLKDGAEQKAAADTSSR